MKKTSKNLFRVFCAMTAMLTLTNAAMAGTVCTTTDNSLSEDIAVESDEPMYLTLFDESSGQYRLYENPNYPRANVSMNKESNIIPSRYASSYELGITMARRSYNVYTEAGGSTTVGTIGSSRSREIVRVNSEKTVSGSKWYNITYKTGSGTKTGYIQASNIDIPSRNYNYSKVMTAGTWTQDYGYNGHAGVDIGGGSQSVYAFTSGNAHFFYDEFQHPDDNRYYLISYGNYVQQYPSLGTTTYAHLSSFNGFSASSLPSKSISKSDTIYKNNRDRYRKVEVGSRYVSGGEKLGMSGSTGNSTGTHLHFEITGKDPFRYVLFPDYGYVS